MRVVVLHRYPAAEVVGTNASFLRFVEKLLEHNHKVYYLTYKDPFNKPKIPNVGYLELPFSFKRGDKRDKTIKTFLWLFLAPLWAWRIASKNKIDLFYCDDSVPYYGFLIKLLVGKKKVIIRLGDLQSGYSFASQGFPKNILFKLSLFLERFMWNWVDGLVAISQPFKKFLINQGIPESKIKLVEESIDLDHLNIQKQITKGNKITVMFHGAIIPCKGLETFIKVIPLVLKNNPSVHFVIAGGGSDEERIRKMGDKFIKDKKLVFTGWYNHEVLNNLMEKVDIGVVMRSSNLANNFVVTTCLLEYWSYKKPVIVPNLEAMRGTVKNLANGLIFEPDNEKDLADKITILSRNAKLRTKMGENGWITAKKHFEKNLIADKMVRVLEQFLTL